MFPICIPFTAWVAVVAALAAACSGAAEPGRPQLEPAELDFGRVPVGVRITRTVFVRNLGPGDLKIRRVSPGPRFDVGFDYAYDDDRAAVPPGGQRPITVGFRPSQVGAAVGSLLVETSGRDENGDQVTVELPISGTGETDVLALDPPELSFGNVVVGTTATRTMVVRNDALVDLQVSLADRVNVRDCASGGGPSTFCVAVRDRQLRSDGSFDLPSGASVVLQVSFTPAVAGTRERGSLVFETCNDVRCEVPARFDGLGVESGFRCDPPALDFSFVTPEDCRTEAVECTNIANEQVTLVSWGGDDDTSEDFTFEAPRVIVVNPGNSATVDVTYCPAGLGSDEGTLVIETDSQATPEIEVPLVGSGGGGNVEVIPNSLDFGLASLVGPSRRSLWITNVGFAPLLISQIVADPLLTGAFSYRLPPFEDLAAPLHPGDAIELTVEFRPQVEGPVESTLVIGSSDADEPQLEVRLVGEGVDLQPCQYEVWPPTMSFGGVGRTGSARLAFVIRNVGSDECLLTSVRMASGSDHEFQLATPLRQAFIAPGAALAIPVAFSPTGVAAFSGAAEFTISAPEPRTFGRVDLEGSGVDSGLLVAPRALDFGVNSPGCTSPARSVRLHAANGSPATITSVSLVQSAGAFSLARVPQLPVSGSSSLLDFDVEFRPAARSDYAGAIEIEATVGGLPRTYVVSLLGRGRQDGTQVDTFRQSTPKMDVLLVVDHATSMSEVQSELKDGFGAFLAYPEAQATDFQVGVTTTDVGREGGALCPTAGGATRDRIATPNSRPSPTSVLADNLPCGSLRSSPSAGFEAAYTALSAPQVFGANAGFLRRDAALSLVFVSNRADRSPRSLDFYFDSFAALKVGRPSTAMTISAVSGPQTGTCTGPTGRAEAGPRYVEMAQRGGGAWHEICASDWASLIEQLSPVAFGLRKQFPLRSVPTASTVAVTVDGVSVPAVGAGGEIFWTYEPTPNAVVFRGRAVPEPGAEIEIAYTTECL